MAISNKLVLVAVALATVIAVAAAAGPSGSYCGSYISLVSGKVTFSAATLDVTLEVFGTPHSCTNVAYTYSAATNVITIPSSTDPSSCVGQLIASNGLTLSATYNPSANTIALDAGIATINMDSC